MLLCATASASSGDLRDQAAHETAGLGTYGQSRRHHQRPLPAGARRQVSAGPSSATCLSPDARSHGVLPRPRSRALRGTRTCPAFRRGQPMFERSAHGREVAPMGGEPAASWASVQSARRLRWVYWRHWPLPSLAACGAALTGLRPRGRAVASWGNAAAGQFVGGSWSQISPPREIAASSSGLVCRSASSASTSRPIPSRFSGKRAGTHTKP